MLYTGKNPHHHYSEDQFISDEDYHDLMQKHEEFVKGFLKSDIRDWNKNLYGIESPAEPTYEEERKRKFSNVIGVLFIAAFIATVVLLILKQIVIGGIMFCSFFVVAGASLLFTGKSNPEESSSTSLKNRIMGLFIMAGSLSIIGFIVFRDHFRGGEAFVWIFVAAFGGAGLCMLILTFVNAFSRKLIYTATADAKCTGYVRKVDYEESNSSTGPGRRVAFMYTSPVWEYSYEGERFKSVYDSFTPKKDSDVALGDVATIHIDPKHPENVMNPLTSKPAPVIAEFIFSLLFIGAAIFMTVMIFNGTAAESTVETSWNPALGTEETAVTTRFLHITDDDVMSSSAYATYAKDKEWYVEEAVVANVEKVVTTDFDGYRVDYTDDSFASIWFIKDDPRVPQVGDRFIIFYILDDDADEKDYGYKGSFSYLLPSEGEYTGTHGAYRRN